MLSTTDVGRILGEERRDGRTGPLGQKTVSQYLVESAPGGRFEKNPFPAPHGHLGNRPFWLPEQEAAIRDWARSRPGQGARTDLAGARPAEPDTLLDLPKKES